jgi:hypothetical protein
MARKTRRLQAREQRPVRVESESTIVQGIVARIQANSGDSAAWYELEAQFAQMYRARRGQPNALPELRELGEMRSGIRSLLRLMLGPRAQFAVAA